MLSQFVYSNKQLNHKLKLYPESGAINTNIKCNIEFDKQTNKLTTSIPRYPKIVCLCFHSNSCLSSNHYLILPKNSVNQITCSLAQHSEISHTHVFNRAQQAVAQEYTPSALPFYLFVCIYIFELKCVDSFCSVCVRASLL